MKRSLNPKPFNEIANHLQVRPYLGGEGPLDLTNIVENIANFCFLTDDECGAYIFASKGSGIYEVHTLSFPSARGKAMFKLMRQVRAHMFLATDCIELNTYIPDGLDNVVMWANGAGFNEDFKRQNCFNLNGKTVGLTYYSLSYEDWVLKDIDNLSFGKSFHELIGPDHDEDKVHDFWVGATLKAFEYNNWVKATSFYNKWANRSGYLPISVASYVPLVVDVGTHILALNKAGLEVLKDKKCQPPH